MTSSLSRGVSGSASFSNTEIHCGALWRPPRLGDGEIFWIQLGWNEQLVMNPSPICIFFFAFLSVMPHTSLFA